MREPKDARSGDAVEEVHFADEPNTIPISWSMEIY